MKNVKKEELDEFKSLVVEVQGLIGRIEAPIFAHIFNKYNKKFILDCVKKMPEYKLETLNPKQKTLYLSGICNRSSTGKDLRVKTRQINLEMRRL